MNDQEHNEEEEAEEIVAQRTCACSKNKEIEKDNEQSKRDLTGNKDSNNFSNMNQYISSGYIIPERRKYIRQLNFENIKNNINSNNHKKRGYNSYYNPLCTCNPSYYIRYDCNSNLVFIEIFFSSFSTITTNIYILSVFKKFVNKLKASL